MESLDGRGNYYKKSSMNRFFMLRTKYTVEQSNLYQNIEILKYQVSISFIKINSKNRFQINSIKRRALLIHSLIFYYPKNLLNVSFSNISQEISSFHTFSVFIIERLPQIKHHEHKPIFLFMI